MRHADGTGRRLLIALADRSPAFSRRPHPAMGGFGRRLLAALADAAPAFRPAGDELDTRPAATSYVRPARHAGSGHGPATPSGSTPAPRPQPDWAYGGGQHDQAGRTLRAEELEELLSALREAAPGSAHPACRVETRHAALDLLATPQGTSFTVAVTITSSGRHVRTIAATIALEVNDEYFVAELTPHGLVVFRGIPAGEWILRRIHGRATPPGEAPGLALPLPRQQAGLAAARSFEGTVVVKAALPDAGTWLILHHERHGHFLLEVDKKAHSETLSAVAVRYGTADAGEGFIVIPARRSGLAHLAGYSPVSPWQASQVTAAQLLDMGEDFVGPSVRAAANNVTRRAWREIGDVEPVLRQVIGRELEDSS